MTQTNLFTDNLSSTKYGRSVSYVIIDDLGAANKIMKEVKFDGSDVDPGLDNIRLTGQLMRIYELMKFGSWFSLGEIAKITEDPESSVSAQLRNFRKERFGSHTVNRRRRGEEKTGLWEYQLIINKSIKINDEKDNVI